MAEGLPPSDPLSVLAVIPRLEVGPVRLEEQRLVCPYRVVKGSAASSIDLLYRYGEPVFQPGRPGSANLAAMVAAQVALNYGLFCEEIVFHGPFDRFDRRFLNEMARNTAREILVKKFLEPNPFLREPFRGLPPVKARSYLRSRLVFPDPAPPAVFPGQARAAPGQPLAVLSSGGKESLLTYGLLEELGREVHPVFINESGRHWFTALNAYRYFKTRVDRTARVWTNADRVFTWMLRHLDFIRPDFASLRSDQYPVRLWTLAVLIFGALPLLRRLKIGHLVVGDEFDTTVRARHQGIPHFDGLFDQSIFFDQALTSYYHDKGWGISQFSVLRPLSELLVEKILTERYPDLQRHQVSCHAAHKEGDLVRPCGRCEKCRRVVGMLMALGADPGVCGYTPAQVEACLKNLSAKGVHQEEAGARQMMFLLGRRGLLPGTDPKKAGPRTEVMKLRFDPVRSPLEAIPRSLRRPLYGLMLDHAQGAVRRTGRVWVDFDPLTDPALDHPFEGEPTASQEPAFAEAEPVSGQSFQLGHLTWPQARTRFQEVDLALLPVGAIEQHGPHLPLDTDAFDADYLARRVAEACSEPKPLVLPLIPYGVSYHHHEFPGTISVSPDTLAAMVRDVGMSAAKHGVTKLVIINGHGGNSPALHFAAQLINRDARIFTCVESGETSDVDLGRLTETPNDVHAGEVETSTSLAVRPELVRMDRARPFIPQFSSRFLDFTAKRSVAWYAQTIKLSPTGVLGDPTKATTEKGMKFWEIMILRLKEFVEDLKGLTLEEIYQNRY